LAEALARNLVSHELVTMRGRGHGFDEDMDDRLVKDAFNQVLAFLDKHVKRGQA
jgi:dipeptidyl aminopeptidase/acylaminoacyl peptidase